MNCGASINSSVGGCHGKTKAHLLVLQVEQGTVSEYDEEKAAFLDGSSPDAEGSGRWRDAHPPRMASPQAQQGVPAYLVRTRLRLGSTVCAARL